MRSAVEISMYPLTGEYRPLIQAFIDRLNTHPELDRADQCAEHPDLGPAGSSHERSSPRRSSAPPAAAPAIGVRHEGAAGPGARRDRATLRSSSWAPGATTSWVEILAAVLAVAYLLLAIRQSHQLLGRRVRQLVSVRVGVFRCPPVHGIGAECFLCRHGGVRILAMAAGARTGRRSA